MPKLVNNPNLKALYMKRSCNLIQLATPLNLLITEELDGSDRFMTHHNPLKAKTQLLKDLFMKLFKMWIALNNALPMENEFLNFTDASERFNLVFNLWRMKL